MAETFNVDEANRNIPVKKCPFCGSPATHAIGFRGYKVECTKRNTDDCPVNLRTHYSSDAVTAAELWNIRND